MIRNMTPLFFFKIGMGLGILPELAKVFGKSAETKAKPKVVGSQEDFLLKYGDNFQVSANFKHALEGME